MIAIVSWDGDDAGEEETSEPEQIAWLINSADATVAATEFATTGYPRHG